MEWPTQLVTYLLPRQQARINWLRRNVVGHTLEVGCSWGYILSYCNGHVGIDLNPDSIAIAQNLARDKEFHVGDARNLPILTAWFDTVMLPDIIEHVAYEDVKLVLREARRVCKPGGNVLATTPVGDTETEDATCMKHYWLPTTEIVRDLFPNASMHQIAGFWCIREAQNG